MTRSKPSSTKRPVLLAIEAGKLQELVDVDRRFDLTKFLNQIVAFHAWRKRFYIRSHPAGEINQTCFEWPVVIELVTPHGLAPGLRVRCKGFELLYCQPDLSGIGSPAMAAG